MPIGLDYLFGSPQARDQFESAGFGVNQTLEDLRRQKLQQRLSEINQETQTTEPLNMKKARKQDFFSMLPLMAAIITSNTSGDLANLVGRATGLLEQRRSERAQLSQRDKERAQRAKEKEADTIFEELSREDEQSFREGLQEEDIKARENLQDKEISSREDIARENRESREQLQKDEFKFRGELARLQRNHDKTMSEVNSNKRKEEIRFASATSFAETLATSGLVTPETAREVANAFHNVDGAELSDVGKAQVNLWGDLVEARSAQERQQAIVNHLVKTDGIEVPMVDENGNPKVDLNGKPVNRKLSMDERLSMYGGVKQLAPLLEEDTDINEVETSTGQTVNEVEKETTLDEARQLIRTDTPEGEALKAIEDSLNHDWDNVKGAKFVRELVSEFQDPEIVNAVIDSFIMPTDKKEFLKQRVKAETTSVFGGLHNLFGTVPSDPLSGRENNSITPDRNFK